MRLGLWVIFGMVVLAAGAVLLWPRGVKAVVRNAGDSTMRDVRVVVAGRAYTLGDIRPNEIRSARVNPAGESDITIVYTDGAGTPKNVRADCYIESGYSGSIRLDVAGGVVTRPATRAPGRFKPARSARESVTNDVACNRSVDF
jgi:hypothetical protein